MASPAQFAYTYESRQSSEKPVNNATYISASTRDDPNFKWQNSGQRTSRGQTVYVRATKRKMTPEYKAYLAAEKGRREAELDVLSGLIGQMTMVGPGSNNRGNYAASLITGMTSNQRRAAAQQAAQLKAEINTLNAMMSGMGMEGGKKRSHTKRSHTKRRHTKRRHTRRN